MINAVTQSSREVKNSKKFGKILEVRNVQCRVVGNTCTVYMHLCIGSNTIVAAYHISCESGIHLYTQVDTATGEKLS